MKKEYDLSKTEWALAGYTPYLWAFEKIAPMGPEKTVDTGPVKARVPGSVQASLLDAGIIEDWNTGDNSKKCEWVENRHWIYSTYIPDEWIEEGKHYQLLCLGLDYSGWIYLNDRQIAEFKGTHIPHAVDLGEGLAEKGNLLEIVFDTPPRWLGQFGYTSGMTEWKTRFNYTWDWIPRMVQTGIWDDIRLVASDGEQIKDFRCNTDVDSDSRTGKTWIQCDTVGTRGIRIRCMLQKNGQVAAEEEFPAEAVKTGVRMKHIPVELWWPNLEGEQPLYDLTCMLLDEDGHVLDETGRRVGFRHICWTACDGAPEGADPWVCVVNGEPVFLQGFNFQPIRPNYADLKQEDYRKRLAHYRSMGANCFRINACGFLEKEWFYDLCDEMGFLVWQEFPLTSSGIENWPPEDERAIGEMSEIAKSYIIRRQHHVSLMAWGGGNEQMGDLQGNKTGMGKPCDASHPMLKRLKEVVAQEDPTRRYIPTSPLGPTAGADEKQYGKGLHWNVHGPNANFESKERMRAYWNRDDALFRAEIYVAGANSADMIRRYKGNFDEMPASVKNPYWRRPTSWWNDWNLLIKLHGREPDSLEEYVSWSQANQAEQLAYAMKKCKERFPAIGGALMWGSHETFPVPVNTTVLDFGGNPKPAAYALKRVWRAGEGLE